MLTFSLGSFGLANTPECNATRKMFQDTQCCGDGNGEAFCAASRSFDFADLTTRLDEIKSKRVKSVSECFEIARVTHSVPGDCQQHFANAPGGPAMRNNNQKDNSRYLKALADPKLTLSKTTVLKDELQNPYIRNFQHSHSLTDDAVYIAARTAGFSDATGLGGLYKFHRGNLSKAFHVGGFQSRYAPVIAGDHAFITNWGYFDPTARYLIKIDKQSGNEAAKYDMNSVFDFTRLSQSIAGPMASSPSTDPTCGTRLYLSSITWMNYAPTNVIPNTRPLGIDQSTAARGRLHCICSETGEACWDSYYFNGKEGGMPVNFDTVQDKHVNTDRSDYLGTLRQVSCLALSEPLHVRNLIPKSFRLRLDTLDSSAPAIAKDSILSSTSPKVLRLSVLDMHSDQSIDVGFYGGFHNTPSLGDQLTHQGATYTISGVESMVLEHAYANSTSLEDGSANKAYVNTAFFETTWPLSSFDETVLLQNNAQLVEKCNVSLASKAVPVGQNPANGQTLYTDYSGITVKAKYSVGDMLPPDGREAVHSGGSNSWTTSVMDEETDTLYVPFGNAHSLSADRYLTLKPLLDLQQKAELARRSSIEANDKEGFRAAIAMQKDIIALTHELMPLLSKYDASFKEDSVHAIDATTGALKWSTAIEGTDNWGLFFTSSSQFDQWWDAAAASTLMIDSWGDNDVNNVKLYNGVVYAWSKGGGMVAMNKDTGEIINSHLYGPGVANGDVAGANYGGACVLENGYMVAYKSTHSKALQFAGILGDAKRTVWITQKGQRIAADESYISMWHPMTNDEVVIKTGLSSSAAGISCLGNKVFAVCGAKSSKYMCEYDVHGNKNIVAPRKANTVSLNCAGNECIDWADIYLSSFVVGS